MPLAAASRGWSLLVAARVKPDQGRYRRFRGVLEFYGKEKVYGSIP
jgi:hypothetical protein